MAGIGSVELLLLGVVFAVVTGIVAARRGRATAGWAFLGFLFGPVPLLIVALLPSRLHRQRAA